MRLPLWLVNSALRYVEKPNLANNEDIINLRWRFIFQARLLFQNPPFATYLLGTLGKTPSVPVLWASAKIPKNQGIILYFHGGGYMMGSPDTHRAMLARLSALTGLQAVLPDYRLCPEHPFPSASNDALSVYLALIDLGYPAEKIVLGGDSAGGGLMFALLHLICTRDLPRPAAAFALSPWTDLTLSGGTLKTNEAADSLLPVGKMAEICDMYLCNADAADPRASPIFGDFPHAPPVYITVGDREILLDDSRRMATRLQFQKVEVQLNIKKNLPHVWPIFQGLMEDSDLTLLDVSRFIKAQLP